MEGSVAQFCLPARLYLILGVLLSFVHILKYKSAGILLLELLFTYLWTILLNWICTSGFSFLTWILFVVPFVSVVLDLVNLLQKAQDNTTKTDATITDATTDDAKTKTTTNEPETKQTV